MTAETDQARQRVIAEALTWERTPYHPRAAVKGAGVDCLMMPAAVYRACGIVPAELQIPEYPPDWHLHNCAERYLNGVMRWLKEVEQPSPGDFALFRFGRTYSHGAIVIAWPKIIHAWINMPVMIDDADRNPRLAHFGDEARPVRFFTPWP